MTLALDDAAMALMRRMIMAPDGPRSCQSRERSVLFSLATANVRQKFATEPNVLLLCTPMHFGTHALQKKEFKKV